MLEDRIFVWRAKHGSRKAMGDLYEKHVDRLVTIAAHLLGDGHFAQDVVHDVFVAFARDMGTFRLTGNVQSYLTKCVVNRCRDEQRRLRRRRTTTLDEMAPVADPAMEPWRAAAQGEQLAMVYRALGNLPDSLREVVTLRLHGGLTFREVAKLQQVPVDTAKSRYRYALERLRRTFNQEIDHAVPTRD